MNVYPPSGVGCKTKIDVCCRICFINLKNAFQQYILGSNEVRPLRDYLMKIGEIVNPHMELGFGKHPFRGISLTEEALITKELFDDIGFSPVVAFDEGIKMTANWIRKQEGL